jgi:hypothetical protein
VQVDVVDDRAVAEALRQARGLDHETHRCSLLRAGGVSRSTRSL